MAKFEATIYEHYHDKGDDAPPTIEASVYSVDSGTYTTGFKDLDEAKRYADKLNRMMKDDK